MAHKSTYGVHFVLALAVMVSLLVAAIYASEIASSPFPTIGQRRSINRLLGPLGSFQYRFDHKTRRVLSNDDISSILFQNHEELKLPFRTQFTLSHNRREVMVKRLMFELPHLTPFVLPSLIDSSHVDFSASTPNQPYESTPYFTADEKLVLNLLQQLQSALPTISDHLASQSKQPLSTRSVLVDLRKQLQDRGLLPSSSASNNTDFEDIHSFLLQDNAAELIDDSIRTRLLTLYTTHLDQLFGQEDQQEFVLSDFGSSSPLFNFNGIKSLDKSPLQLPILLLALPDGFTTNAIVQRFIKQNPSLSSISAINTIITSLQANSNIITQSQKLLTDAMLDTGSTAYIYEPQQYTFWLQLLTTTSISSPKSTSLHSIREYLSQDNIQNLALHPYYLWDAYTYPITKPTRQEFVQFPTTHSQFLQSAATSLKHANSPPNSTNSLIDAKNVQFYEDFCNVEISFTDPVENLSRQLFHGSELVRDGQKMKLDEAVNALYEKFSQILHRNNLPLYDSPNKPSRDGLDFAQLVNQDDREEILKSLPIVYFNAFYTHPFYSRSNQEELLLGNVDLHGVVSASIHNTLFNNIMMAGQFFSKEISATISSTLQQALLDSFKYHKFFTQEPSISLKFEQFIQTAILPLYFANTHTTIQINPTHPTWLLDIIESNKDTILTPEQLEAVHNGASVQFPEDLETLQNTPIFTHSIQSDPKFNLNTLFVIFQTIYNAITSAQIQRSFSRNAYAMHLPRYNGVTLPVSVELEARMTNFLQTFHLRREFAASTVHSPTLLLTPSSNNLFTALSQFVEEKSNQMLAESETQINDVCSDCIASERILYNQMRDGLGDKLFTAIEPICKDIWPAIAPYIGHNMCDPTIPGECYALCVGMLNVYKESVADLLSYLSHGPEKQCFKQGKCSTDPDSLVPQFPDYQLPYNPGPSGSSSILHVSDIHYDAGYSREEGSRVRCKMPICCYKTNTTITDMPLAMFSLANERNDVPRQYGEYLCDSPAILVESSSEQILLHCTSSIVYTGDSPAHDLWRQDNDRNVSAEQVVTDKLGDYARKCKQFIVARLQAHQRGVSVGSLLNTSENEDHHRFAVLWNSLPEERQKQIAQRDFEILSTLLTQRKAACEAADPNISSKLDARSIHNLDGLDIDQLFTDFAPQLDIALGNHAYSPVNHFSGLEQFDGWLLKPLADLWGKYVLPQAKAQVRFGAFYVQPSAYQPNVYIISLHTGLYDKHNPWRMLNIGNWDASGQMHFLESALAQIAKINGKAILIMHEPHGDATNSPCAAYMMALYRKYGRYIVNVLAGHQHHDYTMLIHSDFPVNMTSTSFQQRQFYQQHLQTPFALNMDTLYAKSFTGDRTLMKAPFSSSNLIHYTKYNTHQFTLTSLLTSYRTSLELNAYRLKTTAPTSLKNLQPLLLELLPSSITPLDYSTNPAFRVYSLNSNNIMTDFQQIIFDLETQPKSGSDDIDAPKPEWKVYYTSHHAYPDLKGEITAVNWHNMIVSQSSDMTSAFWSDYTLRYWGFVPYGIDPEVQEERWDSLGALCAIFTHSNVEEQYCLEHWNDPV